MEAFEHIAFLAGSPNRLAVLEAVWDGPRERNDLQDLVGVSRSTINRVLDGLTERGWLARDGRQYRLTPSGRNVTTRFSTLLETIESDWRLREVIHWLPTELPGFETDILADATITIADPGAPYRPMERLIELGVELESTRTRSFGTRPLPGYFDQWNLRAATTAEVIFTPLVAEALRESPPERTAELLASGDLVFRIHDDLPCGLTLYDEHVALCGYDQTSGMLHAVVDTDAPDALAWAETLYATYYDESEPVAEPFV